VHLLFSKLTPFDPVENDISKVGIFCEISRPFLVFGFK
jgi:hypothetical protein